MKPQMRLPKPGHFERRSGYAIDDSCKHASDLVISLQWWFMESEISLWIMVIPSGRCSQKLLLNDGQR